MTIGSYPKPKEVVAVDETITAQITNVADLCRRLEGTGQRLDATPAFADRDTLFLDSSYPFQSEGLYGYIGIDPINRETPAGLMRQVCVNAVHVLPSNHVDANTRMQLHFEVLTCNGPSIYKLELSHQARLDGRDLMRIGLSEHMQNNLPYANVNLSGTRYDPIADTSILVTGGVVACTTLDPTGRQNTSLSSDQIPQGTALALELLDAVIMKPVILS